MNPGSTFQPSYIQITTSLFGMPKGKICPRSVIRVNQSGAFRGRNGIFNIDGKVYPFHPRNFRFLTEKEEKALKFGQKRKLDLIS